MAVVVENSKFTGVEASITSHSLSFGFTATANRLLVLGVQLPGGAATINTIDSGWVSLGDCASGTRTFTAYWYYKIASGGETGVSLTTSSNQAITWEVIELSGLASSSVLDQTAENETYINTTTTTLDTGTTATLSVSDGYAIAFLACDVSGGWNTGTSLSDSYTSIGYNAETGPGGGFGYKQLSSTTGATTTWSTTDAGEQTYAAIAVFKQAAASGVTGTISATWENFTSSITGTTTVVGTLSQTLSNFTSSIDGSPVASGNIAQTLEDHTSSMSGSIGSAISGTITVTLENFTQLAQGTTTVIGTVAVNQNDFTSTIIGTTTVIGTSNITLDPFIMTANGYPGDAALIRIRTLVGAGE